MNEIANRLQHAATVTLRLAEEGVRVLHTATNKQGTVMIVDRAPPGVQTATKMVYPNGRGGKTRVLLAIYHGCQLQWLEDEPGEKPVPRQKPDLRVVSHA
ncbi:MAG: hypothetical protein NVV60_01590 [Luteimonas sp.]|nr:hypothetical protein [Luteimonas sp.]